MENLSSVGQKKNIIIGFIIALLIAYAITAIAFISLSIALTYTSLSEEYIPIIVTATTLIAVMVAGFDVSKCVSSKGYIWGMIVGLTYAIILEVLGIIFASNFAIDARTVINFTVSIAAGGLGGIVGINLNFKNR